MLRRFVHPVTCCCMSLGAVARSLKPVKLSNQQLPTSLSFRDQRGVEQQCWIRLNSSSNISLRGRHLKGKGKGVLGAIETRGPGRHCWGHARALHMVSKVFWIISFSRRTAGPNIVGSCRIRLHATANTDATTFNIVGPTMLGVKPHKTQPKF